MSRSSPTKGLVFCRLNQDPPAGAQPVSNALSPWSSPVVVLLLTSPSPALQDVALTAVRSSLALSKPKRETADAGEIGNGGFLPQPIIPVGPETSLGSH